MRVLSVRSALLACALLAGFTVHQVEATTVLQMNLQQLAQGAKTIVRGEIVGIREESMQAGGGTLSVLRYTVAVNDVLKGDVATVKGQKMAEFRILGKAKDMEAGRVLPSFPVMQRGKEYLLFVGKESSIGLTSTVGLAQGCFDLLRQNGVELAVNGFDNMGLFKGMSTDLPNGGPVPYSDLAALVRDSVD